MSYIESKLLEVFDELIEELSCTNSGILIIHLNKHGVAAFGVRANEIESNVPRTALGLTVKQQDCFQNLVVSVFKQHPTWTDGEVLFPFTVHKGILSASVHFRN